MKKQIIIKKATLTTLTNQPNKSSINLCFALDGVPHPPPPPSTLGLLVPAVVYANAGLHRKWITLAARAKNKQSIATQLKYLRKAQLINVAVFRPSREAKSIALNCTHCHGKACCWGLELRPPQTAAKANQLKRKTFISAARYDAQSAN